ncbi:MAG: DUF2742 domain-containing protein [Corynebacteriales bacterium]|nr:DUF2742 domain-containing protein [Mycobacteriales bacterium]
MTDQLSWEAVRDFTYRLPAHHRSGPTPGSTTWRDLSDDDPLKLGGLVRVGSLWVLETEIAEIDHRRRAEKAAAVEISTALPWARIAREIQQRDSWYASHPDLRRRSA